MLATRKSLALSAALALVATLLPLEGIPAATDISNSSQGVRLTQNKQAPLSLTVNGIQKADTIIVLLRTTDVLVRESDLLNATVPMPQAVINDVNGTRYVSLDSLIPHVTYRIDLVALSLDLQIEPSLLGHSIVNVSGISPNNQLAKTDPSGFLTYSVSSDTSNLAGQLNGFIQAGAGSATTGLFLASGSYADGERHRGLFAYQRDSELTSSRLTLGDEYTSLGGLGANVVVGGFGSTRHFEFQPESVYFPTPGLSGTTLSPTTADLYVNGTFVRSVQLAPGTFNLSQIPVPPGAGVTQVVLHDIYGNTQTINGSYYQTRELLQKGLTDYDYHVGFLRNNPFGISDLYGPLAELGSYRLGVSDALTAGVRVEQAAGIVSGGPQVDVGLPIGHLSLEADGSKAFGVAGHAYGVSYDYFSSHFGLNLSAQTESAHYATASLGLNAPRQLSNVRESLVVPLSRSASLNMSNTTTTSVGQPAASQLLASVSLKPRSRNLFLTANAERDAGGSIFGIGGPASLGRWTIGVQATVLTSRSANVMIGTSTAAGASSTTVELSKSAPNGPGFGYQVQGSTGADRSVAAQIAFQSQYGDVDVLSNAGVGAPLTTLTVTGSLVGFRQGLFFTRPISGAYTLVDVPRFARLPVFFDEQYAGSTDGRDAMVVPNLSPYYDNQVRIDDLHDRLDLIVDKSVERVRTKSLSGVVTTFDIKYFHAYAGHIVIHRSGHLIIPVFGQVIFSRAGHQFPTDLGGSGQFYIENLEPGEFTASVTTSEGFACTFPITFNSGGRPVTSLGTIGCESAP